MNLKDIEQAAYTAPVVVSDEMVRIALDEYYPLFIPSDTAFEDMRRALTAVIPHLTAALSSAPSFKVRELVWDKYDSCDAGVARYNVYGSTEGAFTCVIYPHASDKFRSATDVSLEEAKAAAQADYERRILSALQTTQPVPEIDVAAVRKQALEDAVAIAFETSENGQYNGNGDCSGHSIYQQGAREVHDELCELISDMPSSKPAVKVDESRVIQLEVALTSILFEDSDKSEQQRMIDRVKARAVLEQSELMAPPAAPRLGGEGGAE